eukprot:Opistho-2@14315
MDICVTSDGFEKEGASISGINSNPLILGAVGESLARRRRSSGLLTIFEHPTEVQSAFCAATFATHSKEARSRRPSFELHRTSLSVNPNNGSSLGEDSCMEAANIQQQPLCRAPPPTPAPDFVRRKSVTMLENIGASDVPKALSSVTFSAIGMADGRFHESDHEVADSEVEREVSSVVGSGGSLFFGEDFEMDTEGHVLATGPLHHQRRAILARARAGPGAVDADVGVGPVPPAHYMRKRRNAICLSRTQYGGICKRRMLQAAANASSNGTDVDSLRVELRNLAMR